MKTTLKHLQNHLPDMMFTNAEELGDITEARLLSETFTTITAQRDELLAMCELMNVEPTHTGDGCIFLEVEADNGCVRIEG